MTLLDRNGRKPPTRLVALIVIVSAGALVTGLLATRPGVAGQRRIAIPAHPATHVSQAIENPLALSNAGTPFDRGKLKQFDQAMLEQMTFHGQRDFGEIAVLATRAGKTFYRIDNTSGPDCFAVGPVGAPADRTFEQVGCVPDFPSSTKPILDMTIGQGNEIMGIAANVVSDVVLVDGAGAVLARAPVINNVYYVPPAPRTTATALSARSGDGSNLYTIPMPGSQ